VWEPDPTPEQGSTVVRIVTIAVALTALAIPARALASAMPVTAGVIRVNASIAAVQVGLPRAAVLKRVGEPVEMYSHDDWGWDGPKTTFAVSFERNRVVRVSIAGTGSFCIKARVCANHRGGIGYLRKRFGDRLRFFRAEDGTRAAIVVGKLGRRRVFTIFGDITSWKANGRFRTVLIGDCDRGVSRPC
jgi:hypothetical protein